MKSDLNFFLDKHQKVVVHEYPTKVDLDQSMVTVCVFAYNHIDYIEQCLEGILMQETTFPFAIYLGEDASSDGTREKCIEYADKYPDIIKLVLHERANNISINGKPSGRFNSTYAYLDIDSKYLAICEGDDYWTDPKKLQMQIDFLQSNLEYGICYTACNSINYCNDSGSMQGFESRDFEFENSILGKGGSTLTMVLKKDLVNFNDYFELTRDLPMGDWPIECLVTLKSKGYFFNKNTATYRRLPQGATVQSLAVPSVYYNSRVAFLTKLYDFPNLERAKKKSIAWVLVRIFFLRGFQFFSERKFQRFRSDLKNAFLYMKVSSRKSQITKERFKTMKIIRIVLIDMKKAIF